MHTGFQFTGRYKTVISLLIVGLGAPLARADLFVSDDYNNVVDHYNSSGALVNFTSILGPTGLALGPDGNLYVATPYDDGLGDGASVVVVDPGTGQQISTFTSHVADNNLNNPAGIAFDSSGNLYVADLQSKILVYNSSGGADVSDLTGINLNAPNSIAFGAGNVLYAADVNNGTVLQYNAGAFSILNTSGAMMNIPHDVGVGQNGDLYVLDISGTTGGIYELNPGTGFATEIVNYSTSSFFANDLAVGPGGNLFVSGEDSNTGDGEILEYSTNGLGGGVYLNLGSGADPTFMAFSPVPEPSALALGGVAGVALGVLGKRRKLFGKVK